MTRFQQYPCPGGFYTGTMLILGIESSCDETGVALVEVYDVTGL